MAETEGVFIDESQAGAKLTPQYHQQKQDVCGVPVVDIQDTVASAKEETFQSHTGSFLLSGAFWLGIERALTEGIYDALFLACLSAAICGGILLYFGWRQATRRISRLERYLPKEELD